MKNCLAPTVSRAEVETTFIGVLLLFDQQHLGQLIAPERLSSLGFQHSTLPSCRVSSFCFSIPWLAPPISLTLNVGAPGLSLLLCLLHTIHLSLG